MSNNTHLTIVRKGVRNNEARRPFIDISPYKGSLVEPRAARAASRGSVDHLARPDGNLDQALRQFGEDMLTEPIPQKLLQALDDKGRASADLQDQGAQRRYPHAPFRAPPAVGGLRLVPFCSGLGSTELFSRPVFD